MASIPPGPNSGALDGPPPSPANQPPPPNIVPRPPDSGPMPGGTSGSNPLKGLLNLGAEIDRAISHLAQSLPPDSAGKLRQAKQLVQSALASALSQIGDTGNASLSPTAAGSQFPGGGLTPGKI